MSAPQPVLDPREDLNKRNPDSDVRGLEQNYNNSLGDNDIQSGIQQLENLANSSSGGESFTPGGNKTASNLERGESQKKEKGQNNKPGSGTRDFAPSLRKDPSGPPAKAKGSISRIKKIVGAVSVTVALIGFGFSVIFQGPLQIIHAAQFLQQIHFTDNEQLTSGRLSQALRYYRDPNAPQNRRLGYIAQRFAEFNDIRLEQRGLTPKYNAAGFLEGYDLDTTKITKSDIEKFRQQGVQVDTDRNPPRVVVSSDVATNSTGRKATRVAQDLTVSSGRFGRTLRQVGSYIQVKRAGLNRRIGGNVRRSATESLVDYRNKVLDQVKNNIGRNTKDVNLRPDTREVTGEDGETRTEVDPQAESVTSATGEVSSEVTGDTELARTSSVTGRVAAGGLSAAGAACLVYGVASNAQNINVENIQRPLMQAANVIVSLGSQAQAALGGIGLGLFTFEELGILSEVLYKDPATIKDDPNTSVNEPEIYGKSYTDTRWYQKEAYGKAAGPDIPADMKPTDGSDNTLLNVLRSIQVDDFCRFQATGPGTVLSGLADLATGGRIGALLIEEALSAALGDDLINILSRAFINNPILPDATGRLMGHYMGYGGFLLARNYAEALGAEEQNSVQTYQQKLRTLEQERIYYSNVPLKDRLFDIEDNRSLVAKLTIDLDYTLSAQKVVGNALAALQPQNLATRTLPSSKIYAATTNHDYGLTPLSYSQEELDDPAYANSEANAEIVALDPEVANQISVNCYGMQIATGESLAVTATDQSKNPDECTAAKGAGNEVHPRFVTSVRFHLLDSNIFEAASCNAGIDNKACENLGIPRSHQSSNPEATQVVDGLINPPGLGEPNSEGYYYLPEPSTGEWIYKTAGTPESEKCGTLELVQFTHTMGVLWHREYGTTLNMGDLNAAGHLSHRNGVDVDIYGTEGYGHKPMTTAEQAIQLGKWAYDTGIVKEIYYNYTEVQGVVNEYAGNPNFMFYQPGHEDHFHVRLKDEFRGPRSEGCAR